MNKFLKTALCAGLCGTMMFAVACNDNTGTGGSGGQKNDPETRALALSISAPDGNFNPFFYTSAPDGQVINMTQAALITANTDSAGKVYAAAGEDYPTVAKDFRITFYDAAGNKSDSNNAANGGRTEYEFLIKKGMKFSNNQDLTIRDVLFNFYVYLDTAYTGSNTMYSVDIQGLNAYQNNDSTLADDASGNNASIIADAQQRLRNLINYGIDNKNHPTLDEQGSADLEKVKKFYREELETDWTSLETSWAETFKNNYKFSAAWQAYLFQEGVVGAQYAQFTVNGAIGTYEIRVNYLDEEKTQYEVIDPADKEAYAAGIVLTTLDPWYESAYPAPENPGFVDEKIQQVIEGLEDATSEDAIEDYITENGGTKENALRELTKEFCIEKVYNDNFSLPTDVGKILMYWATGDTAYNYFLADERSKALENSENQIYYIKGIQADTTTTFSSSVGRSDYSQGPEYQLGDTYDVLRIVVNNVDPAAIWQFGISIAPITYYSGTYKSINYINTATAYQKEHGWADGPDQYGVKRGDPEFFDAVIKGNDKAQSGVPIGAGPYKASTSNGGTASTKGQFLDNYIVYYERNTNFHTMGEGIENAKIKYLRYKVTDDDRIISSVINGAIDYGEPAGNTTNQATVNANLGTLEQKAYDTNGYGYVGINPTYVPDIKVRRLIMSAMNVNMAKSYYGDLGKTLYRPMSRTSWAYPNSATSYYTTMGSTQIKAALQANPDYSLGSDGVWYNYKTQHKLKYTFTIAGGNTDHPAYLMFQDAAKTLNQAGFQITVSTDQTALAKLAKGQLTVWAAAWSTGVDPDMYQVYHKSSNATSVLNWGYRTILNDTTGNYNTEKTLVDQISKLIEQGREDLDEDVRADIYSQCLDKIMEFAVELPIYQRSDLCIFNKKIIDAKTVNQNPNSTIGVIDRIWLVNYV